MRRFKPLRKQRLPPAYMPPVLDIRVRLRNPGERPATGYDDLNRPLRSAGEWGVETWAHRRDRAPMTRLLEDGAVLEQLAVFTIRERDDLAADVLILYDGLVYASVGPAVHRGGAGSGRAARYLELYARLRT